MRWRPAPVYLSLMLLAACSAKEPESAEAEAKPESGTKTEAEAPKGPVLPPVGSRVLLGKGHKLAIEPKLDGRRLDSGTELARIAEVVGHVGDELIELRNVPALDDQVCGGTTGVGQSFEIHFYATLDELEPVLGKPKQVEFDDGTKLAFAPGVPIIGEGADARLRIGAHEFELSLAADEIAHWFQPASVDWPSNRVVWSGKQPLYYGEQQISAAESRALGSLVEKQSVEDGTRLRFVHACGQFTLRADLEAKQPERGQDARPGIHDAPPRFGILGIAEEKGKKAHTLESIHGQAFAVSDDDEVWGCTKFTIWTAPEGAKLLWRETGTEAGRVRAEIKLPYGAEEVDGKLCLNAGDAVNVCIETSQLRQEQRDCAQGYAVGGLGPTGAPRD